MTYLLTLNLQNVQVGSTFDLTKLTYSDGMGSNHTLVGPYTKVNNQIDVENVNVGKYFFDSFNNKLIVNLTEADSNTIILMADNAISGGGNASDTISAASGWNTYNFIDAGVVIPKNVTVQN